MCIRDRGKVVRNAEVRLVRDGIVIHEGKISSLKRFKDDAKEVATNYECGIGIENYNDIKMCIRDSYRGYPACTKGKIPTKNSWCRGNIKRNLHGKGLWNLWKSIA